MSFITKTITEEMITPASLIQLEKILIKHGYTVTKTKFSISANKKSFWKSQWIWKKLLFDGWVLTQIDRKSVEVSLTLVMISQISVLYVLVG